MKKIILFLFVAFSLATYSQNDVYKDETKCYIAAQDFVKAKFKYSKEVKFVGNFFHETNGYGNAIVLGKVIAKNAFGVRSEYVYKIWLNHNGLDWTDKKNWTMTKLIIEDSATGKQQVFRN